MQPTEVGDDTAPALPISCGTRVNETETTSDLTLVVWTTHSATLPPCPQHNTTSWRWLLAQPLLPSLCLLSAILIILLHLRHLVTFHPSPDPLTDSDSTLVHSLQQLCLGPAHQPSRCSWLRTVEDMLASTHDQSAPVSPPSSHQLLWPARLHHPRSCLTSATASLSPH